MKWRSSCNFGRARTRVMPRGSGRKISTRIIPPKWRWTGRGLANLALRSVDPAYPLIVTSRRSESSGASLNFD
eukprot:scaffold5494_cov28-Tisochrysis_lutea.AAC.2